MMMTKRNTKTDRAVVATTAFILSEVTEDERARWMRMLVILGLAGVLIIFGRDIVQFMTGVTVPVPPPSAGACPSGAIHGATGLPCDTVRALSQLFVLSRYIGIAITAIGGALAVVKL
ncbi:hypothetical protein [Candidatus Nitrosocaldus islandicus]|uniref:hypothetical protein n=1 Tax=Candidatus Nitrosocaldus islandicus TaxID=2045011 RepID=UPI0013155424|nr:hypothetical protein [Candidatus Nitrosocaldus islandicus]